MICDNVISASSPLIITEVEGENCVSCSSSMEFAGDDMDKAWEIHSRVRRQLECSCTKPDVAGAFRVAVGSDSFLWFYLLLILW